MDDIAGKYNAKDYLDISFERKGIGGWRRLYLRFIDELAPGTILELGAGAPDFLNGIEASRRVAIDIGVRFAKEFRNSGIEFYCRDLEADRLSDIGPADVAVCSDVFEHLINPAAALRNITTVLKESGILFSHVPNEFRFSHVLRVMLGYGSVTLFHKDSPEWNDPHFRRFSDLGYCNFLRRHFQFNLRLTDLRYRRPARCLSALGLPVPFCLQGGPTYASTNNEGVYERLKEIKRLGFR